MPELPEVETVRRSLERTVSGKTISSVKVFHPKMIRGMEVAPFVDALKQERIERVERRGKFLLFTFDRFYLVSHLRMEGKYFPYPQAIEKDKHTHVIFRFTDGSELHYNDVRKFGTMELREKETAMSVPPLAQLEREPFDPTFTAEVLAENLIRKKRSPIKTALLDQSIFLGLGNIYVDETLFTARVHPLTKAGALTLDDISRIHAAGVDVLAKAVESGGSTIRSYVSPTGKGEFQLQLAVYGQTGAPCPRCGTAIEKIKVGGRGTHFCPTCQQVAL
ncbi:MULTISPECIES: DNA-formamidopyrimidine glycosylase [unclassified Exiguobacterium]|uniref:DNA-formamidopyrimidine glycosylase n=1 Tax=unclassified Exiguobacterium TaxID=2644629 RepID=UPI000EBBE3A4|nr:MULTISPECIES: DNA-formamidopyrimidine glycosylase [unclassified Exiguobacterium]MDX1258267.1 DNA-formamidopyrimidine glycosylase [Exiguobacterium sp. K1]HCN57091.1 DNA-formamidopyrimidine glycosylase [Exiguobacterium sp.]